MIINTHSLTSSKEYKDWLKRFLSIMEDKDRTYLPITHFLVWDIDDRDYKIRSEYNVTHNQIALYSAHVPQKSHKNKEIEYKQLNYP